MFIIPLRAAINLMMSHGPTYIPTRMHFTDDLSDGFYFSLKIFCANIYSWSEVMKTRLIQIVRLTKDKKLQILPNFTEFVSDSHHINLMEM